MLTVEQAKARLQGVCVPLATIFKDDGALDIDSTRANVEWIIDQGAGRLIWEMPVEGRKS